MRVAACATVPKGLSTPMELSPFGAEWLAAGSSSLTRWRSLRVAPAPETWLSAEGGGAASFLSGRRAQSRWLGQAAPARGQPLRPLTPPGGSCSFTKPLCCLQSREPPPPRSCPSLHSVGPVKVRAPACNRRSAGSPLLARHAESNPDRKAEQTPERLDWCPQPPPLRPELRPSPNFPVAAPLVSAPPHEYLYRADSVSALGLARQSQGTGRSLPALRPSLP